MEKKIRVLLCRRGDEWWEGKSNRYPMSVKAQTYLGKSFELLSCMSPILKSPLGISEVDSMSPVCIMPYDTSPLTHSVIAGDVGVQSIRDIPSRQVS